MIRREGHALTVGIHISPGELWDRITILEIKAARVANQAARRNVRRELTALLGASTAARLHPARISALVEGLRATNLTLWHLEDQLRDYEHRAAPARRIADCALSIRRANDARAALKRRINDALGCRRQEEKQYGSGR